MFNLCEPFGAGNVLSDVFVDFDRELGSQVGKRMSETPLLWDPQEIARVKVPTKEDKGYQRRGKRLRFNTNCDMYTAQVYSGVICL